MLHFTVICVGGIKEKYMKEAIADYAGRLSKYARLDIVEASEESTVSKEGEAMLARIPERAYVIALDLQGKMLSSTELSEKIEGEATNGKSHFVFLIGGSEGLSDEVRRRADYKLSMSAMTFPHQLARLIILEQLYRAMKISRGEKYHK